MAKATTTLANLTTYARTFVGDTGTTIWTDTDFATYLNLVQTEILNDIVAHHAEETMADHLMERVTIPLVAGQEEYDFYTAITNASKTYFAFRRASWGDNPVRVLRNDQYELTQNGLLSFVIDAPAMCFDKANYFRLIPTPADNTIAFTFFYISKPATMTESETSDLDERCTPLYAPKVARWYWLRRKKYYEVQYAQTEYDRLFKQIVMPYAKYPRVQIIATDNS